MNEQVSSPFYGVATVGTKGQIVIPAEAREDMNINPGDKVIVVGRKDGKQGGVICILPVEKAERFVEEMTSKLQNVRGALKKAREEGNE